MPQPLAASRPTHPAATGPSSAVLGTYARQDLVFERGEGSWLVTTTGERYLDFGSGVAVNALGHAHPRLVAALTSQAQKLWHTSNLYRVAGQERLAETLVAHTFADQVFFCNSGAEACEGAIKAARRFHFMAGHPERNVIITFDGAFHGRTLATIAAGGNAKYLEGFGPDMPGFRQLPFGDLAAVEAAIGPDTAAIMSELDLVISSDTSTAHLAAALGCPTWVLLHYASDWRWGLGDSTPWYPQARLFRQARYARWDGVVKQVRDALLDTFDVAKPKSPRKHTVSAGAAEEVPPMLAEAFALYRKGSPHLARMAARAALGTHPQRPDAWCLLGVVERALGDAEAAERAYRKAIELLPGYGDAWFNLGNLHRGARRLEQAKAAYEEVIRQQPAHAQALSLLSDVMRELQDLPAAERLARTAVDTQPEFAEAWGHLGNALNDLERFDEAARCYERALQLPNPPAETHYNKGVALQRAGHVVESIECYRTILAAKPAEVNAHYNLATALLTLGQFEEGFREYEWRLQKPDLRERTYAQPAWKGESLAGKRILLYWEQGYGDTLQFLRFLPLLAERGARIVLELQAGLKTLAAPLPGVEAVFDAGETLPPFDVHAPLISVPARLGLDAGRLPSRIPYLSVPAELTARWRLRLGRKEKPLRVGLVWGGNPNVRSDRVRSPRLKPLLPLIRIPGIQWIVLQQGDGRRDLEALHPEGDVLDIAPEVRDFADTGAIMNSLDMMISSDTSTAHLAAALGVPTWALLHYAADWRWMEGEGTVWYPELRAFRQRAPGAWDEVVSRVGKALETATRPTQRERVPA